MWRELVIDSLVRPRAAARRILAASVPDLQLLQGTVVVACLWTVLLYVFVRSVPQLASVFPESSLGSPIIGALLQVAETLVISFLIDRIGRIFGGRGTFHDALTMVVWYKAVGLIVVAITILLMFTVPTLAAVFFFVLFFWMIWMLANFVTELHGFQNPFIVLGASVLAAFVLYLATGILFAIVGSILQETT
jgi:hypothetical protein